MRTSSNNIHCRITGAVLIVSLLSACAQTSSDFARRFPPPLRWHAILCFKSIDSVEELRAYWHENANSNPKKFVKAAYYAVIRHPDNVDMLMMTVNLFPYCDPNFPRLASLMEYALERHYYYRDHRCGAYPADTVAGIVKELAELYVQNKEADKAIAVVEELLNRRKTEVNDHLLEFLSEVYAKALYSKGDTEKAIHVLENAITEYNGDWEKDLRTQLEFYRKWGAKRGANN
jgi:tetratricopeptide (TPR) repeat protein